ncbi:hypothetical protein [Streptomyces viridochromogenes]|nr:hypothetical protein [Streptomyces viridochromogenes]
MTGDQPVVATGVAKTVPMDGIDGPASPAAAGERAEPAVRR